MWLQGRYRDPLRIWDGGLGVVMESQTEEEMDMSGNLGLVRVSGFGFGDWDLGSGISGLLETGYP